MPIAGYVFNKLQPWSVIFTGLQINADSNRTVILKILQCEA